MQSTSNYSLNLVEGTDLVNIPVQLNPNFQTVDAEMFKNKQSGIGTATEVVTGTVHAVVRSNPDADMFRFTATGAWAAGDTMTLDGSAVTVHLSDGTAPAAGAYIIGAEVVAVVNGTLVTLLTSNGAIDPGVTSFNSRTGAVTPASSDYDGSMIDYDNTGSGLTATDVQSAIDELAAAVPSVNLRYDTIATAAANQTYGDQITYLKTAFDALTTAERLVTALMLSDAILLPCAFANTGTYSLNFVSGTNVYTYCGTMSDGSYKMATGASVADASSINNGGTMKLVKLVG